MVPSTRSLPIRSWRPWASGRRHGAAAVHRHAHGVFLSRVSLERKTCGMAKMFRPLLERKSGIVLAARLRPSHFGRSAFGKVRGRAGRRGLTDPRASACRHTEAERRSRPRPPSGSGSCRKSAVAPASRARCLRLAPHDPRWAEFSEPLRCCGLTGPTHRCGPSTAPGRWHGVTALPPRGPVSPTRGDGIVRLGPPEPGCASPHPGHPATASRPAS